MALKSPSDNSQHSPRQTQPLDEPMTEARGTGASKRFEAGQVKQMGRRKTTVHAFAQDQLLGKRRETGTEMGQADPSSASQTLRRDTRRSPDQERRDSGALGAMRYAGQWSFGQARTQAMTLDELTPGELKELDTGLSIALSSDESTGHRALLLLARQVHATVNLKGHKLPRSVTTDNLDMHLQALAQQIDRADARMLMLGDGEANRPAIRALETLVRIFDAPRPKVKAERDRSVDPTVFTKKLQPLLDQLASLNRQAALYGAVAKADAAFASIMGAQFGAQESAHIPTSTLTSARAALGDAFHAEEVFLGADGEHSFATPSAAAVANDALDDEGRLNTQPEIREVMLKLHANGSALLEAAATQSTDPDEAKSLMLQAVKHASVAEALQRSFVNARTPAPSKQKAHNRQVHKSIDLRVIRRQLRHGSLMLAIDLPEAGGRELAGARKLYKRVMAGGLATEQERRDLRDLRPELERSYVRSRFAMGLVDDGIDLSQHMRMRDLEIMRTLDDMIGATHPRVRVAAAIDAFRNRMIDAERFTSWGSRQVQGSRVQVEPNLSIADSKDENALQVIGDILQETADRSSAMNRVAAKLRIRQDAAIAHIPEGTRRALGLSNASAPKVDPRALAASESIREFARLYEASLTDSTLADQVMQARERVRTHLNLSEHAPDKEVAAVAAGVIEAMQLRAVVADYEDSVATMGRAGRKFASQVHRMRAAMWQQVASAPPDSARLAPGDRRAAQSKVTQALGESTRILFATLRMDVTEQSLEKLTAAEALILAEALVPQIEDALRAERDEEAIDLAKFMQQVAVHIRASSSLEASGPGQSPSQNNSVADTINLTATTLLATAHARAGDHDATAALMRPLLNQVDRSQEPQRTVAVCRAYFHLLRRLADRDPAYLEDIRTVVGVMEDSDHMGTRELAHMLADAADLHLRHGQAETATELVQTLSSPRFADTGLSSAAWLERHQRDDVEAFLGTLVQQGMRESPQEYWSVAAAGFGTGMVTGGSRGWSAGKLQGALAGGLAGGLLGWTAATATLRASLLATGLPRAFEAQRLGLSNQAPQTVALQGALAFLDFVPAAVMATNLSKGRYGAKLLMGKDQPGASALAKEAMNHPAMANATAEQVRMAAYASLLRGVVDDVAMAGGKHVAFVEAGVLGASITGEVARIWEIEAPDERREALRKFGAEMMHMASVVGVFATGLGGIRAVSRRMPGVSSPMRAMLESVDHRKVLLDASGGRALTRRERADFEARAAHLASQLDSVADPLQRLDLIQSLREAADALPKSDGTRAALSLWLDNAAISLIEKKLPQALGSTMPGMPSVIRGNLGLSVDTARMLIEGLQSAGGKPQLSSAGINIAKFYAINSLLGHQGADDVIRGLAKELVHQSTALGLGGTPPKLKLYHEGGKTFRVLFMGDSSDLVKLVDALKTPESRSRVLAQAGGVAASRDAVLEYYAGISELGDSVVRQSTLQQAKKVIAQFAEQEGVAKYVGEAQSGSAEYVSHNLSSREVNKQLKSLARRRALVDFPPGSPELVEQTAYWLQRMQLDMLGTGQTFRPTDLRTMTSANLIAAAYKDAPSWQRVWKGKDVAERVLPEGIARALKGDTSHLGPGRGSVTVVNGGDELLTYAWQVSEGKLQSITVSVADIGNAGAVNFVPDVRLDGKSYKGAHAWNFFMKERYIPAIADALAMGDTKTAQRHLTRMQNSIDANPTLAVNARAKVPLEAVHVFHPNGTSVSGSRAAAMLSALNEGDSRRVRLGDFDATITRLDQSSRFELVFSDASGQGARTGAVRVDLRGGGSPMEIELHGTRPTVSVASTTFAGADLKRLANSGGVNGGRVVDVLNQIVATGLDHAQEHVKWIEKVKRMLDPEHAPTLAIEVPVRSLFDTEHGMTPTQAPAASDWNSHISQAVFRSSDKSSGIEASAVGKR